MKKKKSKQQVYVMQYAALKVEVAGIEALKDEDLRGRQQERAEANKRTMDKIERAIESLEDPLHRTVMRARYIDVETSELPTWETVALIMFRSEEQSKVKAAQRLHGRALQAIAPIIARIEKEKSPS